MKKMRKLGIAVNNMMNEKIAYTFATGFLLFGHAGYILIFFFLGVRPMMIINIFSVLFYIAMLMLNMKTQRYQLILMLEVVEIVIHAIAGLYYMGWDAGFQLFLICVSTIPFFASFKKRRYPLMLAGVDMAIFLSARILAYEWAAPYHNNDSKVMTALYIYNAMASIIVIVYISSYNIFVRELMATRMKKKNEHLQRLATIDPLTELFNRRAMMEYIKIIDKKASAEKLNYNICIADIDDFKKINDTYGHDAGDEVLRVVSSIFIKEVPSEGYVCRWGGEEIMFAMPPGNDDMAIVIAERIRAAIEAHEFDIDGKKIHVTMTFGVCRVRPEENYDSGITRADKRLYDGKRSGKNMVVAV